MQHTPYLPEGEGTIDGPPTLRVIDCQPEQSSGPLKRQEAEAMLSVASVMRDRAARLPLESDLRDELLASASDYALAALIAWPSACRGS